MNNDTYYSTQDGVSLEAGVRSDIKEEFLAPTAVNNFEVIETLSNTTDLSSVLDAEVDKPAQLIYGNDSLKRYTSKFMDKLKDDGLDQSRTIMRRDVEEINTVKFTSEIDHVYEEVSAISEPHLFEYDIMDYYEKYSPTTAKTLINTLFLPRHKICKQCANLQDSPVYSDCLIYSKQRLYAREVDLCQQENALQFKYYPGDGKSSTTLFSQYDNSQPCMLVYNYFKTSASSIFYSYGPPRDIFNLKATLKPDILLVTNSSRDIANTELYHRCVSNFYTRVSNSGNAPMVFRVNHENILSSIKHVGYDTDLQNWMNYRNDVFRSRNLKQDDVMDHRANRSSLLLLEPLLLMPELTSSRNRHGKNRIPHSEHMKIVRIVIAYTLSFFILATITFYIVYFT